ncbi:unnamed protein product [Gordionus sp. m RMFG-2023]
MRSYCISFRRFLALRSTFQYPAILANEQEIKILTEQIVNLKFGELSWLQATLPIKAKNITFSTLMPLSLSRAPIIIDLWKSSSLINSPSTSLQRLGLPYFLYLEITVVHSLLFSTSSVNGYEFLKAYSFKNLDLLLIND